MSTNAMPRMIRESLIHEAVFILDRLTAPTDTLTVEGFLVTGEDVADWLIDALDATAY